VWATIAQSVKRLAKGWKVLRLESNPDRRWSPLNPLYNAYLVSYTGVKRPGRGVDHPHSSRAEVKESIELYLYPPPLWAFMVSSRTCLFYLSKSVMIRGYFAKPQGETLPYPLVSCVLADDD